MAINWALGVTDPMKGINEGVASLGDAMKYRREMDRQTAADERTKQLFEQQLATGNLALEDKRRIAAEDAAVRARMAELKTQGITANQQEADDFNTRMASLGDQFAGGKRFTPDAPLALKEPNYAQEAANMRMMQVRPEDAVKAISLSEKIAEFGSKLAQGGGDINQYYEAKNKLEQMKKIAEIISEAKTPGGLKAIWPSLVQAYPALADSKPEDFTIGSDYVSKPEFDPDGNFIGNAVYFKGSKDIKIIPPAKIEKPVTVPRGGAVLVDGQWVTPSPVVPSAGRGGAGVSGSPTKLKPGEVYNPETDTVSFKQGTEAYNKALAKYAKDQSYVKKAETEAKRIFEKIDEIMYEKGKDGKIDTKKQNPALDNLFGGVTAYATQYWPASKVQDTRKEVESLKKNLMRIGLGLIREDGSPGAITQQEWPIFEQMISNISPMLSVEAAKYEFQKIKNYLESKVSAEKDKFETQWGGSQFSSQQKTTPRPPANASPVKNKPDPLGIL